MSHPRSTLTAPPPPAPVAALLPGHPTPPWAALPAPDGVPDQYALGKSGEAAAIRWYEEQGYTTVGSRVRCASGEIDAIVRSIDGTVVFVEVKTRRGSAFGGAEAVTAKKLATMRRCAAEWMRQDTAGVSASVRFDVVELVYNGTAFLAHRFEGVEDGAC